MLPDCRTLLVVVLIGLASGCTCVLDFDALGDGGSAGDVAVDAGVLEVRFECGPGGANCLLDEGRGDDPASRPVPALVRLTAPVDLVGVTVTSSAPFLEVAEVVVGASPESSFGVALRVHPTDTLLEGDAETVTLSVQLPGGDLLQDAVAVIGHDPFVASVVGSPIDTDIAPLPPFSHGLVDQGLAVIGGGRLELRIFGSLTVSAGGAMHADAFGVTPGAAGGAGGTGGTTAMTGGSAGLPGGGIGGGPGGLPNDPMTGSPPMSGGGGGHAAVGGPSSDGTAGGTVSGTAALGPNFGGGSGGGGGGGNATLAGGDGGGGGGGLRIDVDGVVTIAASARISAIGAGGNALALATGGGGGSGGAIHLVARAGLAGAGVVSVEGGMGGVGPGSTGGAGAAGRVRLDTTDLSPTVVFLPGTSVYRGLAFEPGAPAVTAASTIPIIIVGQPGALIQVTVSDEAGAIIQMGDVTLAGNGVATVMASLVVGWNAVALDACESFCGSGVDTTTVTVARVP